jgi:hypothetical protein
MTANKSARSAAAKVYKSEGAVRPPKWERGRPAQASWCNLCSDYTEHDHLGCVECYDPHNDRIEELEDPSASPFAGPKEKKEAADGE